MGDTIYEWSKNIEYAYLWNDIDNIGFDCVYDKLVDCEVVEVKITEVKPDD